MQQGRVIWQVLGAGLDRPTPQWCDDLIAAGSLKAA
jgi:hypothetical protein